MAAVEKQVRVFISSTFRDMHAERDHLVTVVFPELRERVEQLGLEFFDVDLRWGVPAKDLNGETANSWEYCRQWIDRVEPFFVCILGQRYGWVPEPQHFRDTTDRQQQEREPRSITDLEVRHAVLDTRRKRRSYFYLRATPVPEPNTEYVDPPECQDRLTQLKTAVRQCGRPVHDYHPEWTGERFIVMEEFGRLVVEDLWSGVLRDERYVNKDIWRRALGADPDTDLRYTDETQPVPRELWEKLVKLAKPPPRDLLDAEREQMEAFAQTRLRWFQGGTQELEQLTGFINSTAGDAPRLAVVAAVPGQGKSALLAKLSTLIPQPSTFLITHFVGATERSATAQALVDRLLGELDRSGIEWPADEQREGGEPKRDFNSLCRRLAKRLGDYVGERRVVILLDALNQLTDGHDLHWLPHRLGPSVRVVVSCVEDAAAKADSPEQCVLQTLTSRQPAPLRVPLGPLTDGDVRTIVVEYLKEYCKELDTPHVNAICRMEQARNPLYLLVLLGELRTLGGNDMNRIVGERIAALAQDYSDTVSLFRWVLQRLEVFGPEAVRWWCLYLAHGRVGMASHELADLLARKLGTDVAATALLIERGLRRYLLRRGGQLDFFHGQLRQAVMERYGSQAEPAAVHREMADYFTACAKGTEPQKEWETDSVRGFAECVFHLTKAGQHEQATGLLSNFPFLLHKLRVGLLEGVFEDYEMVRHEAPTEMAKRVELWADFFREKAHIIRRESDDWPAHKILLQLAVEHADDSPLTLGAEQWLAAGRCDWLWLRRVPRLPHSPKSARLVTLEGHTSTVNGALELTNGRLLSWSGDKTLRLWDAQSGVCLAVLAGHTSGVSGALELANGRLLSWSGDMLRVWDAQSGLCLAVLAGRINGVSGALELANGLLLSSTAGYIGSQGALELADGRLLSWSADKTLRLWDAQSGVCLAVLAGHTSGVSGALELADGRLLSWAQGSQWGGDNTLRLWNSHTGACLVTLEGHVNTVNGALELTNGRLLSWSGDKTLRLWDAQSGVCLAVLVGHNGEVRGALELAEGRLLSWGVPALYRNDNALQLWDVNCGGWVARLEAHRGGVFGALELTDGRLLSWSIDDTIRLWDGHTGTYLETLCLKTSSWPRSGLINGVVELAGGQILSWTRAGTLSLWESHTGDCLVTFRGHSSEVAGALELADGRLLSWSRDTLLLWDWFNGGFHAALPGHSDMVKGVLELNDGRLLSWSADFQMRLWDTQNGDCLATLRGHWSEIIGILELADGRLLSWGHDAVLCLWNGQNGALLARLEGHSKSIDGADELADGRLASYSADGTACVWDDQSGACLGKWRFAREPTDYFGTEEPPEEIPEYLLSLTKRSASKRDLVCEVHDFVLDCLHRTAHIRRRGSPLMLAAWDADSNTEGRYLRPDGTVVVTQHDGQVCILKLHYGPRRISLAQAEELLAEERKKKR